jgi:dephospho-CoA kinase
MFHSIPILGLVGGIGSGKSYVAKLFGELGCLVIDSDALVRKGYDDPQIRQTLRNWWGDEVFLADGQVNRSAIAQKVFNNPHERQRLEQIMHRWVDEQRMRIMQAAPPQTIAFVWDTPLLVETGLNRKCDAIIYVDAPLAERLQRVKAQRGWDAAEIERREKLQTPLDKKREISDYVLVNSADAVDLRHQVRQMLSRIVAGLPRRP